VNLSQSRNTTSIIKGLAILGVLVAHYYSNYDYDFYARWMFEYAIAFISVFFVLSGFGLFHSLEKRFEATDGGNGKVLLRFAFDRAVRIYPLYWLALVTLPIFIRPVPEYDKLFEPNLRSLAVWLGFPVVRFSLFWFMAAILQCYWAAPIFYFLLKKLGVAWYAVMMLYFIALSLLVSWMFYLRQFDLFHLPAMGVPMAFFYKNYFLGNIILFALGMMIVPLAATLGEKLKHPAIMAGATVLFLTMIYVLRFTSFLFAYSELFLIPLFMASAALFCLVAIINQPRVPVLGKVFQMLGDRSYTLYLFHYQWMILLFSIGLIKPGVPGRAAWALLSLPLLLLVCMGIDRIVAVPRVWLEQSISRKRQPAEAVVAET
jgi:peptidoglycan/LPS O-acetylase OafA/YrhL